MLENLLIYMPDEPIDFLIKHLQLDNNDVPRICILGPPASGKTTIAMWLCKQLATPRISQETLLTNERSRLAGKAEEYQDAQQTIPTEQWAKLIEERLRCEDCLHQGWVLEGLPDTRELGRTLQAAGIIPRHVVVLYAPDTVLIERNLGKRVDAISGEVYHTTFDWPTDERVCWNLEVPVDISEAETLRRLLDYHRNFPGILQSFEKPMKFINADQPCADVFALVLSHVEVPPRSSAPFSPRILLCGPPGCGKSLQAALLSQKYGLINVCCGQLLKEAVAAETKLGELIKPYFDAGWPVSDSIVIKVLSERLNRLDCHVRGWVLHGFPKDEDQARLMKHGSVHPNRVFVLNLPIESIMERMCFRKLDPVTGDRYHGMYRPPATQQVNDRLLRHPKDIEEAVRADLETYFRLSSGIETYFEDAIAINADQDPQTVFEYIESYIVNPLPTPQTWKEGKFSLSSLWPLA